MGKGKSGNVVVLVLLFVAVLAAVLLYLARNNRLAYNINNSATPTYQATTGSSNTDLNQDMNTIDASLKTTTDAETSVNAGINDTPIAQP